jgi:hypothetical protein
VSRGYVAPTSAGGHTQSVALNPFRARRERRELEQRELVAFRTVRQTAREEIRDLARRAVDAPHTLAAARTALEAATTAEEVVAVEPYVRAARATLGVADPEGRRSYQAVVDAARVATPEKSPEQRVSDVDNWGRQGDQPSF